jgi:hypothetical protein
VNLKQKLYPRKKGLTLSTWKMRTNEAYSERGGHNGREWTRSWVMRFDTPWFRGGRVVGLAALVRLNGDGLEVRGRAYDMVGWPSVKCKWTNDNGVSMSNWPHPQGWKWTGVMRKQPGKAEHFAALEREMERQRREIDKRLRAAMIAAGWSGR